MTLLERLDHQIERTRDIATRGDYDGRDRIIRSIADELDALYAEFNREMTRLQHQERALERLALCPDHRDKGGIGEECIVCRFERGVREAYTTPLR